MGEGTGDASRLVARIHRVRCLGCGGSYSKPTEGGTVTANPGCPECGYVGWVLEGSPVTPDALQLRSVVDPLRRRTG